MDRVYGCIRNVSGRSENKFKMLAGSDDIMTKPV